MGLPRGPVAGAGAMLEKSLKDGSANAAGVASAIRIAADMVQDGMIERIAQDCQTIDLLGGEMQKAGNA